jgi:hypothetical protein
MTNPSDTLITPLISSVLVVSKLPEKARVVQTIAVAYISKAIILIFRLSSKIDSTRLFLSRGSKEQPHYRIVMTSRLQWEKPVW